MEERLRKIARREENIRQAQDARERQRRRLAAEELQRRHAAAARKLERKYSGREERPGKSSASPPPPSPPERRGDVAKVFLGRVRHEERKKAEEHASASESIAQARLEALYGPGAAVAVRPLAWPTLAWLRRPAKPLQQSRGSGEEATSASATVGLPDEVWLEVLGFLDFDALQACRGVCSHMRRLASDGSLWRPLVTRLYPRAVERLCACSSTVSWVDWAMQCARATPWNRKETRSSLALPGSSFGSAPTALACRGLLVAVAMSDCTVTVMELCSEARSSAVAKLSWSLPSTGAVLCMDVSPSGRLLACGLEDGSVQVADIRAQAWVATLAPHAGRVSKVLFLGERSVASFDSTLVAVSCVPTLATSSLWIVGLRGMAALGDSSLVVATDGCCHVVSSNEDTVETICSWTPQLRKGEVIVGCCSSTRAVAVVVSGTGGTKALVYNPGALHASTRLLSTWAITGVEGRLHSAQLQDEVMLLVALLGEDGELKTSRFDVSLPGALCETPRWTLHGWLSESPTVAPATTASMVVAVDAARRLVVLRPSRQASDEATVEQEQAEGPAGGDQQQLWEAMVGKLAPLAPW